MNCKYTARRTYIADKLMGRRKHAPVPETSLFNEKYDTHNACCESVKLVAILSVQG